MPKATKGIINSINYGDITTTKTSVIRGIAGRGNAFVGGISSLNRGQFKTLLTMVELQFIIKAQHLQ